MPQKSSTTSSIGQEQATSLDLIYEFADLRPLGASQEKPLSTMAEFSKEAYLQMPTGVTLPPPRPDVAMRGRGPTLQTRQLWEGTVTELRNGGFAAILSDRTNRTNPDEHAVFDYGEVSPEDRSMVGPGSSFYWIIGSERTLGGQVKNVSIVQFRRVPAWTRSSLARATDRAQRIREVFRAQE